MSTAAVPASLDSVIVEVRNGVGRITLNRPRAINALNHEMVAAITTALRDWYDDDMISAVLLDGAGDRGFCAGGDIRAIYDDARGGGTASIHFWRDEYRLNAAIARYPKPVVALMDGLVMGGGVGLSAHASHRVVTDRSIVAMPEVNIGMIPDVGGTYLLAKAPGWLGLHAALTGTRMGAADVIALGMADYYVDHSGLAQLADSIVGSGADVDVDLAIRAWCSTPPAGSLLAQQQWIDKCYDTDSAESIIENLRNVDVPAAVVAADAIDNACPTSVVVTLRAIRAVRDSAASLEVALNREFAMVSAALGSPDLIEGIRAQVVDKDRNPSWMPAQISGVTSADVDRFFADTADLPFPPPGPRTGSPQ